MSRQESYTPHPSPLLEMLECRIAPAGVGLIQSSDLDGTNGYSLTDDSGTLTFGLTVDASGDFNADGYADAIVSGYPKTSVTGDRFVAAVLLGGPTPQPSRIDLNDLDGTNGFIIVSSKTSSFGPEFVGDINGDGADDIWVSETLLFGAPGNGPAIFDLGAANPGRTLALPAFSAAMKVGDLNDDGIVDLAVRNPSTPHLTKVIFGGTDVFVDGFSATPVDGTNGFIIEGVGPKPAGDINGDGIADLLYMPTVGPSSVAVLFGSSTGFPASATPADSKGFTIVMPPGDFNFPQLFAYARPVGDLNGDGFDDILVAPDTNPTDPANPTQARVFFGAGDLASELIYQKSATGDGLFITAVPTTFEGTGLGLSSLSAGDFDGDGFDDLAFTVTSHRFHQDSSITRVIFGKDWAGTSSLDLINPDIDIRHFTFVPGPSSQFFVNSVGLADMNGDGIDDLVATHKGSGGAHVVFGNAQLGDTTHLPADFVLKGTTAMFTDIDGDKVTVRITPPHKSITLSTSNFLFSGEGHLLAIDIWQFGGGKLSVVAKKSMGGDGQVEIGDLGARLGVGSIQIDGSVGRLRSDLWVKSFKAISLGTPVGYEIFDDRPEAFHSNVRSHLGQLTLAGDLAGFLDVVSLGKAKIAGSLKATADGETPGLIRSMAGIESIQIGRNVEAGDGLSGIVSDGKIGSIQVKGSIKADPGQQVTISAEGNRSPQHARDLIAIGSIKVAGDVTRTEVLAGYNIWGHASNVPASIPAIQVKGSWTSSSVALGVSDFTDDGFGRNDRPVGNDFRPSVLGKFTVGGQIGANPNDGHGFFGITAPVINQVKVGKASISGTQIASAGIDGLLLGDSGLVRAVSELTPL